METLTLAAVTFFTGLFIGFITGYWAGKRFVRTLFTEISKSYNLIGEKAIEIAKDVGIINNK